MKSIIRAAALVAALSMLAGCMFARSTVDLSQGPAAAPAVAQPSEGPVVKIVSVDDQRVFAVAPQTPDIPSLKDNNITDKAITARAIGRKRSGWGGAVGDVLLPEGDSVSAHIATALTNGFRQAGYRVLSSGDAGYDQATPVKAVIKQYWSWLEVGFVVELDCRAEIQLDSPLPALAPSKTVLSQVAHKKGLVLEAEWMEISNQGLQALSVKLAEMLKVNSAGS